VGASADNDGNLVGTLLDGRYQILRRLGDDGMGVVYEALHTGTNRRCAVKVLSLDVAQDQELLSRVEREVRITGSLGHQNIIQFTDTGETPAGAPYLVMELPQGKSLGEVLDQQGPMAPERAIMIAIQVLDALVVVHREGVIHRDLKPDNIFLAEMGRPERPQTVVKVSDFGFAQPIEEELIDCTLTGKKTLIGAPHYLPLEQVCGREIDRRADIYAVGVILYELLTGALPFEGDSLVDLVVTLQTRDPLLPSFHRPELPPKVDSVILKAISREREERYATAEEFLEALKPFAPQGLITDLETSHRLSGRGYRRPHSKPPDRLPRKRRWQWWALPVGAIVVAGLVVYTGIAPVPPRAADSGPLPPDAGRRADADTEGTDASEDAAALPSIDVIEHDGPIKVQEAGPPPAVGRGRRPSPLIGKQQPSLKRGLLPRDDEPPETSPLPPDDSLPGAGPLPPDDSLPGASPLPPDINPPPSKMTQ
jgi:serine/threonine-protein kinase